MISMRCFLISSLLLVSSATTALADRKISESAKVELERGEARFRDKDYAGAIAAFDAGYALDPQPIFLYDKAQAQRLSGDCASAIESYKAFLATNPPPNEATRAKKNIASCEASLPPSVPEPVAPVEDREPAPFEDAPRASAPIAIEREQRAWWSDTLGVVLVTSGVVGLGVGVGFAVNARSAAYDTSQAANTDDWSEARDRWQRDRIIAGVALGAGTTLVVSGVLRLSLRDRDVAITPAQSGGALVSIGGAW
jgi:tetratricopeptide (TPR) repeat protein